MSEDEDSSNNEAGDKLDLILTELRSFKRYSTKKFEENKITTNQILKNFEELKKELKVLKKENENQKRIIEYQREKIYKIDRQLLENTVNIQNIPFVKDESVMDIVYKIASKADTKLTTSSIVKAYRKKIKPNGAPGDLVVKFSTATTQESLIAQAKKKSITFENIGFAGNVNRIYINQELTPRDKELFYQARTAQKKYSWKFVWQKMGQIYIRKTEGGEVVHLTSKEQLEELFK